MYRVMNACVLLALMTADVSHAEIQQQYMYKMDAALKLTDHRMAGKPRHPLLLAANLFFAHGAAIAHVPLDTLLKYVDALHDAGAGRVDINLSLDPWRDGDQGVIKKYDAVIARVRQDGMQLGINPEFNRSNDKTYGFKAWTADALKYYPEIAKRYHPEVFAVIHEPTTMAARMGEKISANDWIVFAQEAIVAVRSESPHTRCGVGLLPQEWAYTKRILMLHGLDALSVDIYSLDGLKILNGMIAEAKKAKKSVYVEETWRTPNVTGHEGTLEAWSSVGIGNAAYEALDQRWNETIANYASVWGMDAVTPFWTQTFFLYVNDAHDGALDPAYNGRVIEAIDKGLRTDTFRAYQKLSKEFK